MPEVMTFWNLQPVFNSNRKGEKIQNYISWFYQKIFISKHQNKAEFKNLDDSQVLSSDFPGLGTSLTSAASAASLASTTSTAQFHQRTSWNWWLEHSWHQNDQYWSLYVEWIIKNPIIHWYLISFLSEAVEASLCFLNTGCKCKNVITSGI